MSETREREHRTAGTVYKVWIEIEEYDIERGDGETVDCLPFASCATFATIEQAEAFARQLHELGGAVSPDGAVTHD